MTADKIKRQKVIHFIFNIIVLVAVAIITIKYVSLKGQYPWGSDVYGHIYKSNILYDALIKGDLYLNFDPNWYNGMQPYRYWPPMPYYVIACINFFTQDIIYAYNVFLIVVFIMGGLGFLEWGYYTNRQKLGLFLGILWFFVPINGDIIFSQGNVPFIMVNVLIPHIFLLYYKSINEDKLINYIGLSMMMAMVTLNHPMITAMIGVSMFAYSLCHGLANKKLIKNFIVLCYAAVGIMIASIWLIPALKGGLMQTGSSSTSEYMMNLLTFPLKDSLNPLRRFIDKEGFYFGLSFVVVALLGVFFGFKDKNSGFIVTILILIGTSKFTLPFLSKLPMNQVFWMIRFTPIAMCMVMFSLLLWKELRKGILFFFCCIMILDSFVSFKLKAYHTPFPELKASFVEKAASMAVQRVAMLDCSEFGSFPSYYITYQNVSPVKGQVFGWAWIGTATSSNIVQINYSLEKGYYGIMFDRSLELGSDVLVIRKRFVKDYGQLDYWGKQCGYEKRYEDEHIIIYKYNIDYKFGTIVKYDGLGIGKYAANIIYLFPNFTIGSKKYLEDYSIDELSQYKAIFISGMEFKDKQLAESMVKELSEKGVRIVIDFTGMDSEGFRGIVPQVITFNNRYTGLYYKGKELNFSAFPEEYKEFRTVFLSGKKINTTNDICITNNQKVHYLYKENENLIYIALNLPYYAVETKDDAASQILKDCLGTAPYILPARKVVPVDITFNKDKNVIIKSEEDNVVTSLGAADAFKLEDGEIQSTDNLVKVNKGEVHIKIIYPYRTTGIILSLSAILILCGMSILISKTQFVQRPSMRNVDISESSFN